MCIPLYANKIIKEVTDNGEYGDLEFCKTYTINNLLRSAFGGKV